MKNKNSWQLRAFCAAAKPLLFLLLTTSCTPEPFPSSVCISGDCDVRFEVEGVLDENGYYYVDLDFNQQHYPRFNVELDASVTDPTKWYNGRPMIASKFETNTYWQFQNDNLPVVQGTTIYLQPTSPTRAYSKRIVGPIPPEMKGDTIELYPTLMWDAGNLYEKKSYTIKIIIE